MTNLLQGVSIFLIGMMGTGKTTIGKVLAQQLNYRFFDTDVLIERVSEQSINEIFARQGEESFRELETKVLAEVSALTKSVIATGGGIIMRPMNWSYLRHGLVVWLDAPLELLEQRLAEDNTRPLRPNLSSLLEKRRPLYEQADLHLAIADNQTPEQITAKLIEKIPTVLKSQPLNGTSNLAN
ncbi:shikimate kinase [Candidatus Gracilibacteria bacterium]|nr:shikimate kinase [Candidatus Gracilibacteria bacterium]